MTHIFPLEINTLKREILTFNRSCVESHDCVTGLRFPQNLSDECISCNQNNLNTRVQIKNLFFFQTNTFAFLSVCTMYTCFVLHNFIVYCYFTRQISINTFQFMRLLIRDYNYLINVLHQKLYKCLSLPVSLYE